MFDMKLHTEISATNGTFAITKEITIHFVPHRKLLLYGVDLCEWIQECVVSDVWYDVKLCSLDVFCKPLPRMENRFTRNDATDFLSHGCELDGESDIEKWLLFINKNRIGTQWEIR